MKYLKLLAVAGVLVAGLSACNSADPSPVPVPSESASATTTEAPNTQPTKLPPTATRPVTTPPETQDPVETPTKDVPSTSASTEAGTPATQFAQRWGQRYPNVPEYAILKTANGVCRVIEAGGQGWENDPLVQASISKLAESVGIAESSAFEFAQDANQNYCVSVSNPT